VAEDAERELGGLFSAPAKQAQCRVINDGSLRELERPEECQQEEDREQQSTYARQPPE
jgi:hypothetical protein